MSLRTSGAEWLRQNLAWSNSRSSWQERLLVGAFALLAIGLAVLSARVGTWPAAVLWGIFFIGLAVCSRQGWIKLFGPVLFYDMICTARRSRYVVMRLLYAGLLLFIICTMYFSLHVHHRVDERRTAMLAESFFSVFMLVQIAIVVLLTPAYVAGAIAEEKDRKTLEFLMATDLYNREIVLSKLLSRLANMTILLLTGLPIMSMLQFIGGVDQQLMLAGFTGVGLTMLGIASVSILFSTLFKKPRDAIGLTYVFIVAYMALGTVAFIMTGAGTARGGTWPLEPIWDFPYSPTYQECSDVINAGNPITAIVEVIMAIEGAGRTTTGVRSTLAAALPGILERYAWFHLPVALVCIVWSIVRLRAVALKQASGGSTARITLWERYRPPIGELPMLWKEFHIEGGMKFNWIAFIAAVVLVFLTVGSGFAVLLWHSWYGPFHQRDFGPNLSEAMNVWFRFAGTGVGYLLILCVAVRGASSISSERERDTFDALVATPLSSDAMLAAKLMGSLTSLRLARLWFSTMLVMALLTGGLHLLALPIVVVAVFIYALFFAMVGMWFSMICKTSMRATVLTVLTTLGLTVGHWLATGLCCFPVYTMLNINHPGDFPTYLFKFQGGMTPPAVIAYCSYSWQDLSEQMRHNDFREFLPFCLVGLFLFGMGCVILWYGVLVPKFRQLSRREEMAYQ